MTRKSIIALFNLLEFNTGHFWKCSKHSSCKQNFQSTILLFQFASMFPCCSFRGVKCTEYADGAKHISSEYFCWLFKAILLEFCQLSSLTILNWAKRNGTALPHPIPILFRLRIRMNKKDWNLHFSISCIHLCFFCSSFFFITVFHVQTQLTVFQSVCCWSLMSVNLKPLYVYWMTVFLHTYISYDSLQRSTLFSPITQDFQTSHSFRTDFEHQEH